MVWSKKLKRKVPLPTQSKNYKNALKIGLPQIKKRWQGLAPLGSATQRLSITAYFFGGKGSVPDLDGCLVGAGDLLQQAGVISNDRWISSWDGSMIIEWPEHGGEPLTTVMIREDSNRDSRVIAARNMLKEI